MLAQLAGGYREFLEQVPVPSSTENNSVEDTTYALLSALLGLHPKGIRHTEHLKSVATFLSATANPR